MVNIMTDGKSYHEPEGRDLKLPQERELSQDQWILAEFFCASYFLAGSRLLRPLSNTGHENRPEEKDAKLWDKIQKREARAVMSRTN